VNEPIDIALGTLDVFLNDPSSILENLLDQPEISLQEAARADPLDFLHIPRIQKAALTASEYHGDSKARRRESVLRYIEEQRKTGLTVEDLVAHAERNDSNVASELRALAASL